MKMFSKTLCIAVFVYNIAYSFPYDTTINIVEWYTAKYASHGWTGGGNPQNVSDWKPVIQDAVNEHKTKTRIVFPLTVKPYTCLSLIDFDNVKSFVIEGHGAEIRLDQCRSDESIFWVHYCDSMEINYLVFNGRWLMSDDPSYPHSDTSRGILIDHSSYIIINGCYLKQIRGNSICCSKSRNCIIRNNNIDTCGLNGIILGIPDQSTDASADNNLIIGNTIKNTFEQNGILLQAKFNSESTTNKICFNTIKDNLVINAGDIGIESSTRSYGTIITGNTVLNSKNENILVRDNWYCLVENNYCDRSEKVDDHANITMNCILSDTDPNRVTNACSRITRNTVISKYVPGSGYGNGIVIDMDLKNISVDNNIIKHGHNGILIGEGVNRVIIKSNVCDSVANGIALTGTGLNIEINSNIISNCISNGLIINGNCSLYNYRILDNCISTCPSNSYLNYSNLVNNSFYYNNNRPDNCGPQGFGSFSTSNDISIGIATESISNLISYIHYRQDSLFLNIFSLNGLTCIINETVTCPGNPWSYIPSHLLYGVGIFQVYSTTGSDTCLFITASDYSFYPLYETNNLGTTSVKKYRICCVQNSGYWGKMYGIMHGNYTDSSKKFVIKMFK